MTENPIPMNLGQKLKFVRNQLNLTLDEVEKKLGISKSSLSDYENSHRDPSISQLSSLAEFYKNSISFFLDSREIMDKKCLGVQWKQAPASPAREQAEAEFRQLCRQYTNLETWTGNRTASSLRKLGSTDPIDTQTRVKQLASKIIKEMGLGDFPANSLLPILEETYDVRVFHLPLNDDVVSACLHNEESGPAVLLNSNRKRWLRNFDLAHELFHLLVSFNVEPSPHDPELEKSANLFAFCLLMPEEKILEVVESSRSKEGLITLQKFDDMARMFDVSHDALVRRIAHAYNIPPEQAERIRKSLETFRLNRTDEEKPYVYPERYIALANYALRKSELSLGRYLEYLKHEKITHKEAEEILASGCPESIDVPPESSAAIPAYCL